MSKSPYKPCQNNPYMKPIDASAIPRTNKDVRADAIIHSFCQSRFRAGIPFRKECGLNYN